MKNNLKLYNEDCMPALERMNDNQFDLAIVDPPYGIGINKSGRMGHYGGGGKKWDNHMPDNGYFSSIKRVSKNQIIWGGNYFDIGPCKCFLIWDKKQPIGMSFADGELAWTSFNDVARFFRLFPVKADEYRIHPTQKPVALYKWLLKNYAKKGDTILDTHLGSGSIAIACHDMGFDLTGYELDEDYFEAMQKRIKNHTDQLRMT